MKWRFELIVVNVDSCRRSSQHRLQQMLTKTINWIFEKISNNRREITNVISSRHFFRKQLSNIFLKKNEKIKIKNYLLSSNEMLTERKKQIKPFHKQTIISFITNGVIPVNLLIDKNQIHQSQNKPKKKNRIIYQRSTTSNRLFCINASQTYF